VIIERFFCHGRKELKASYPRTLTDKEKDIF